MGHVQSLKHCRCLLAGLMGAGALGLAWAQEPVACRQAAAQPSPVIAQRIAAVALAEHEAMGGALIDEGGGLIRGGFAEAERDHPSGSALPTWRRVWGYWVSAGVGLPADEDATPAEKRVALIDQPWSAVFISHVMRQAGLDEQQFRFAATHQAYVRAAFASNSAEAFGAPTPYAYRACDVRSTPARVGDLLCATRAPDDDLDRFGALAATLVWRSASMHCDLVVARDTAHIDAVGGNVAQTVVLRRLGLTADGSGLLWPAYLASAHRQQAALLAAPLADGAVQPLLPDTRLSQQPWSVLLQLRDGVVVPTVPSPARDPDAGLPSVQGVGG